MSRSTKRTSARCRSGQKATFTVDAFPNRRFSAHITQVHFASNNTQKSAVLHQRRAASATSTGVVTYETVLEVDNSELLLRPGMTATAEIVTTNITDAVLDSERCAALHAGRCDSARRARGATQQRSPLSAHHAADAPAPGASAASSKAAQRAAWAARGFSRTASRRW